MNYSDKLRAFADYLDKHPSVTEQLTNWDSPELYFSVEKEHFAKVCKDMGGFEKSAYNGTVMAQHKETGDEETGTVFTVSVSVYGACEAKLTGKTKTRKVHIPTNAYQTDEGDWVVTEEVTEYHCPESFLNL